MPPALSDIHNDMTGLYIPRFGGFPLSLVIKIDELLNGEIEEGKVIRALAASRHLAAPQNIQTICLYLPQKKCVTRGALL